MIKKNKKTENLQNNCDIYSKINSLETLLLLLNHLAVSKFTISVDSLRLYPYHKSWQELSMVPFIDTNITVSW